LLLTVLTAVRRIFFRRLKVIQVLKNCLISTTGNFVAILSELV